MGAAETQQENVAVARRSFELYSEGGPDNARPTWAEDCVWNDPVEMPDADVYRGHEAVAARLNELWGVLPLDDLEVEEAVAVNDSDVLLILGFHAKGGGSGIPVDQPMGCIVTIRDGLCAEWRPFLDQGEARREAGL
jgi:ketosteroid isomerase-like protein